MDFSTEPVPLFLRDGVAFITGTRVPLDTVVYAFREGATPEEIVQRHTSLRLVDVYAAIAYYLRHTDKVDRYLEFRRSEQKALREEIEAHSDQRGIRERLLARRPQSA